jgi:hypothetical protein
MRNTPVILKTAAAAVLGLMLSTSAQAATCAAAAPAVGAVVHGPVLQVLDADHLCVATGAARDDWVELLIKGADEGPVVQADRLGPALLMSVAFARTADCAIVLDAKGRKVADCRIDGQKLSDLLRRPGAIEAANAWLKRPRAVEAPIQLASR